MVHAARGWLEPQAGLPKLKQAGVAYFLVQGWNHSPIGGLEMECYFFGSPGAALRKVALACIFKR